jgi:hypothetical protein
MTDKIAPKEVWVICCGDSTTVFATLDIAMMARDVMESLGHTPDVVKAPMFWRQTGAKPIGRPKGSRNRNHGGAGGQKPAAPPSFDERSGPVPQAAEATAAAAPTKSAAPLTGQALRNAVAEKMSGAAADRKPSVEAEPADAKAERVAQALDTTSSVVDHFDLGPHKRT